MTPPLQTTNGRAILQSGINKFLKFYSNFESEYIHSLQKKYQRALNALLLLSLLLSSNGCEVNWAVKSKNTINNHGENLVSNESNSDNSRNNSLNKQSLNVLRVAVFQDPLIYQKISFGNSKALEHGYEFEILKSFAEDNHYQLKIEIFDDKQKLAIAWQEQQYDISLGRHHHLNFLQSAPAEELHSSFKVTYNEESLSQICQGQNPRNMHQAPQQIETTHLSRKLSRLKEQCLWTDSLSARYWQRYFSRMHVTEFENYKTSFYFAVQPQANKLYRQLNTWVLNSLRSRVLSQIKNQFTERIDSLTSRDIQAYKRAEKQILPQYIEKFKKYAEQFSLPWQLIAAVAYQESHWDESAVSYTGVEGFMQLTQETAEYLGVEDRNNCEQSIWGGSKYLKLLFERQPDNLSLFEKWALTLATYNLGPAHVLDVQKLAQNNNLNPYQWRQLSLALPWLEHEDYQDQLFYGKARGRETLEFVNKVMAYVDLMM